MKKHFKALVAAKPKIKLHEPDPEFMRRLKEREEEEKKETKADDP
eukprot:CAMPEP_0170489550 /NCGR_PEP_ID=MMETSP0208-20121228/7900_1 /TAXON_ID=197538 /ORGANISM="Strombidium inclinatum, Strain S3" /LENGTH=44 /DNA_ID= /DNA_START= /DNA_END= /DNA_ORIENTATION=